MAKFGKTSIARLNTCHPDLQRLFNEVIKEVDCTILCGHRTEEEQTKAFESGNSQVKWPNSKHNSAPSLAVDVAPYPIEWNNIAVFKALAGIVKKKATELGIAIEWGGDWKTFKDYPHYQLKEK